MKQAWLRLILQHPWSILLCGLLLIIAASMGAQSLYFRGDYKAFFEENDPQRMAFENMQASFTKNETANIVIAPKSGDVFTQETLQLISEITEAAWQTPFSTRVDSISNFQYTWSEDDDLIVEDLIPPDGTLTPEFIARAKRVALNEPNLVKRLISTEGHVAVVAISVNIPDDDLSQAVKDISHFVIEKTAEFKVRYPEHDFYHTGMVIMNNAFDAAATEDASTLVPAMFAAIVIMLLVLLRSLSATIATVLVIFLTITTTLGLAGWMGYFLSTATVNVPTLVMTLAVADCVHVIASMFFAMRRGSSKEEAINYSLRINLMPIFITSVTTAIGFLTLNFAKVPVLADLGNLTALGIMLAFVFSVTLLPAMLRILPIRLPAKTDGQSGMERFADWVVAKRKLLLPGTFVISLIMVGFASLNQVNDIATDYFDKSTAFRQATDFQQKHLSGMSSIDFAIFSGVSSGLNDPKMLAVLERFSAWLRAQPEVDHVATITDTFKRLNKNMHGDDEKWYRLPENQELAAQYLLLYEMSLPYGLDVNNQVNMDKSGTRISVLMQNLGSKEFTAFERRAKAWMQDNGPEYEITAGSPNLMFAHIGEANMQSMLKGTLGALVLISGLLVLALRSWRLGLISLIPNLLPAGIGFGIWGLYSGQINMGLSVVLSMTLGVIVDDTVHYLSKYRHARLEGHNAEAGVRYAFSSVGKALLITTLVLVIGFGVLSTSSFALNADMGLLTGIIILVALLVDFLLLPPFLMKFDKKAYTDVQVEQV